MTGYIDPDAQQASERRLSTLAASGTDDADSATEALAIAAQLAEARGQSKLSSACLDDMEAEAAKVSQ